MNHPAAKGGIDMGPARDGALKGMRIAMLMTDGVEQVEFTRPRSFLEQHGAEVTLLSPKPRGARVQAYNHAAPGDLFTVEMDVRHARADDFDALVLPGGVANPDGLRMSPEAIAFIGGISRARKPIAAICHGPWPLIDAGIVRGRRVTSWPSLRQDLCNAGATWSDQPVVVDGQLVTSRNPDDIPQFEKALLEQLAGARGIEPCADLPVEGEGLRLDEGQRRPARPA
jgi:protease I